MLHTDILADDLVERTGRTLSFGPAEPRDTQSLRNWLDGNRRVARDETAYLLYERDLFSLSPIVDNAATRLENWIEDRLAQLSSKLQFVSQTLPKFISRERRR
jgi:hypothetical protein